MNRSNSAAIRRAALATGLFGGLLLAGCASLPPINPMTAEQCAAIDWAGVGRDDGARGAPSTELARHVGHCPGLPPQSQAAWAEGRAQGLRVFCTPESGYALGRAGREYHGVCPADQAQAFLIEYERGLSFRRPAVVYAPNMSLGWGWGGPRVGVGMGWGWRSGWW